MATMTNSRSPLQVSSDAKRSHPANIFEDLSEWLLPNGDESGFTSGFSLSPAHGLKDMNINVNAEPHEFPFSPMVEIPSTETMCESIMLLSSISPHGFLEGTEGDKLCIPRENAGIKGQKKDEAKCLGVKRNIRSEERDSPQRKSNSLCEKKRRRCMNELFTALQVLLPSAIPKNDKSTVLDEIIKYIHVLQNKVEELKRQKSVLLISGDQISRTYRRSDDSNGGDDNANIITSEGCCDAEHSGMISCKCKSKVDVKMYDNEGVVISILSSADKMPGCLLTILEELEVLGLHIVNVSIFRSGTVVFQHLHTKCPDASKFFLENSLRTRLESLI